MASGHWDQVFLTPYANGEGSVSMRIRIGILGYGNLGKGVEKAVTQNEDQ